LIKIVQTFSSIDPNVVQAAMKVESMQSDMTALKTEVRDTHSLCVRMDALCVRKEDVTELRERLSGLEPYHLHTSQLLTNTQSLTEDVYRLKGTVSAMESSVRGCLSEQAETSARVNSAELLLEKVRQSTMETANNCQVYITKYKILGKIFWRWLPNSFLHL
jgi:uncharacterized protein YoxC